MVADAGRLDGQWRVVSGGVGWCRVVSGGVSEKVIK